MKKLKKDQEILSALEILLQEKLKALEQQANISAQASDDFLQLLLK